MELLGMMEHLDMMEVFGRGIGVVEMSKEVKDK
jgi:hypothetical protein